MLDIAFGDDSRSTAVTELLAALKPLNLSGSLYLGYPILKTSEGMVKLDALLTCIEYGVVAFDLTTDFGAMGADWEESAENIQSDIAVGIETKLLQHRDLRQGRNLAFNVHVISLVPESALSPKNEEILVASRSKLPSVLHEFSAIRPELLEYINASFQTTTTLRPKKKRISVTNPTSKGGVLKEIEKKIANLDRWQKKAAIEFPEGPQRIRGLAGSGKTIVLAQKAALLHAKYPEWDICVTFNTRSLYQQFQSLIRRFSFEINGEDPDWDKIKILHAWGSLSSPGVYSEIAKTNGAVPRDFSYAKAKYGMGLSFSGVCQELASELHGRPVKPMFDVILIDEAQDLPIEFFEIVYRSTRSPKRVVWAYDELQNLGDYTMPPAEVLFGKDGNGQANVRLENRQDQPQQDIILRVCYRNTPWALAVAHALGFGIYRSEGLVQMFDEIELWNEIGYKVKSGSLSFGKPVSLIRSPDCSPAYFTQYMTAKDAVKTKTFDSRENEAEWIAKEIKKNLSRDELEYDDILIVIADPLSARSIAAVMMRALKAIGLDSHLAGVTASRDLLFTEDSIALTSIHRAKGNEAPMVYVLGAESCFRGYDLSRKRNILFTAITRSRAWVRISGIGADMGYLATEITAAEASKFQLGFTYPTEGEIKKLKRIHRDRSVDEKASIARDIEGAQRLLKMIEDGDLSPDTLPDSIQSILRSSLS